MSVKKTKRRKVEPIFSRGDLAKILNVTPLTIANREKRGQYPDPKRDLNGYRVYSLNDVFTLQLLTYQSIDTRPVLSVLYDMGFHDASELSTIIDTALKRRTAG